MNFDMVYCILDQLSPTLTTLERRGCFFQTEGVLLLGSDEAVWQKDIHHAAIYQMWSPWVRKNTDKYLWVYVL